jgi:hypothetical protein
MRDIVDMGGHFFQSAIIIFVDDFGGIEIQTAIRIHRDQNRPDIRIDLKLPLIPTVFSKKGKKLFSENNAKMTSFLDKFSRKIIKK